MLVYIFYSNINILLIQLRKKKRKSITRRDGLVTESRIKKPLTLPDLIMGFENSILDMPR